jgi:hypothetical protein
MQDGKDHNVSKPIHVPSNHVNTKEHVNKRDLLTRCMSVYFESTYHYSCKDLMNMDPVVHISHLSIQCYTCMLDDYCEHCNDHVHYKLLVVILALVMVMDIVVYPNTTQFAIVMQDGKGHNVNMPIHVPSNRVRTKEHVPRRVLHSHVIAK